MPKQRQTCTRCSMRRQKCDRKRPCTRCVQNKEAHLCTTEWKEGYNPAVHRKYPKKTSPTNSEHSASIRDSTPSSEVSSVNVQGLPPCCGQLAFHFRPREDSDKDHGNLPCDCPSDCTHERSQVSNSATNVDFITYGRSDFADISIGTLLREKEQYSKNQTLIEQSLNASRTRTIADEAASNSFAPTTQAIETIHLQSLLPLKDQVIRMIDYHEHCMSYWVGGIYHGPSFRKALLEAYGESDTLDLRSHDWRWCALLFSILSAAIIGSPESISASWGFSDADKLRMSRQWGKAVISSLQLGDYASRHHIYSVQAILNMHTSEHLVGSAKEWAVYQAFATVIARALGLNRLGPHPEDLISPSEMNAGQKEALLQREIGRRVWNALTSQDWLCSTSQGMYTLQRRHYTTIPPRHFDEETFMPVTHELTPTFTHISNYLNEIAHILVRYLDDMFDAPDIAAKYDVVLKYDAIMRGTSIEKMPKWLSTHTPYNPEWPEWAVWARRSYQASCAHKIIMIHQSFLYRSFKDVRYTYSRWACISSSKTIVETLDKRHPKEPQWWVEQAFIVTAGLCLGLDLFHRSEKDPEAAESQNWIQRTIKILEQWPTSSVAAHGVRLLNSLLQEHARKADAAAKSQNPEFPPNIAPQALANAATIPEAPVPQAMPTDPTISEDLWNSDFDVDMTGFEDFMESFPLQGFDNNVFFQSLGNGFSI